MVEPIPSSGPRGRVLLMDDEESILEVMSQMLRRRGFEVSCARDGSEAVSAYRDALESGTCFDAVVMDLSIPGGMGGREAIHLLLEIDPGVRALVSSGHSNDPVMIRPVEHGFVGVLPKPYSIAELVLALERALS
ncbi:Response regulator receiver protein [anaerobic digester metagenome]